MMRILAFDSHGCVAAAVVEGECLDEVKEGDYRRAYKYWSKAATLGSIEAHYNLLLLYGAGQGVEKDAVKEVHHLEVAAIAGHTIARHNLGCNEGRKGNMDRSKRHFIIGANLGDDHCLKGIQGYFKEWNCDEGGVCRGLVCISGCY